MDITFDEEHRLPAIRRVTGSRQLGTQEALAKTVGKGTGATCHGQVAPLDTHPEKPIKEAHASLFVDHLRAHEDVRARALGRSSTT